MEMTNDANASLNCSRLKTN